LVIFAQHCPPIPGGRSDEIHGNMNVTAEAEASTTNAGSPDDIVASGDSNSIVTFSARISGTLARIIDHIRRVSPLFWATVIAPTILATVYFGLLADDIYISESRFVVRSPDKPQRNGLGVLLSGAGFNNASEEVRAAQGFIESRDALRALTADGFARRAWGDEQISIFSRFDPFGWSGSFEDLYKYYGNKVVASYDPETAITTLTVRAFSPGDAQAMNARLLKGAEALVNNLNERSSEDLIKYADREVAEAREVASSAALALSSYRNRAGVIDPERQATVQLQMISKLQDELIGARMQLLQLSTAAGQNPQIPLLKIRVAGLQKEIEQQFGKIAGSEGSLSEAAAEYQRLQLQREFADKQLALSLSALQEARNEARRQRAYVERVAQPSLPDAAVEPRRIRGVLATLIVGLVAWGVLSMLLAGVREHYE
jgi:capsular polysaccharide transport system permease protein